MEFSKQGKNGNSMNSKIMLLFVLIVFPNFSACTQQRYNAEDDFNIKIIDNGKSIEITKYIGTNIEVRIPSRIRNLPVTVIGDKAFINEHNEEWEFQITSVIIPNSVTQIGRYAFATNQITSVTIPDSVIQIGEWAFAYNQITSVIISDSVTQIGEGAFASREHQIISVTIGANIGLDEYVFGDDKFNDFYKKNRRKAGTYAYRNRRWLFSTNLENNQPSTSKSSNPLSNTSWESLGNSRITISFGETSFVFAYLEWVGTWFSDDGWGERKIAGSYVINGDSVILNGNVSGESLEMTGALIGDSLSISGIKSGYDFFRTR